MLQSILVQGYFYVKPRNDTRIKHDGDTVKAIEKN